MSQILEVVEKVESRFKEISNIINHTNHSNKEAIIQGLAVEGTLIIDELKGFISGVDIAMDRDQKVKAALNKLYAYADEGIGGDLGDLGESVAYIYGYMG